MAAAGLLAVALLAGCAQGGDPGEPETTPAHENGSVTRYEAQTSWKPVPEPELKESDVEIAPDVSLHVWDSGGDGEVVVLLHPYSGSGAVFGYQHEALTDAGYRTISYSRRGFSKSTPGPADDTGTIAGDLQLLMDKMGVKKFHLVGLAAGGFAVFDYALSHPDRLLSATVGSTLAGISEESWQDVTMSILPEQWGDLPGAFQEVGPSYRAANPEGLARWKRNEEESKPHDVRQEAGREITWDAIESVTTPLLILSGDADLYMPPSRMRTILDHVETGEGAIISEAGHAAYFEQPKAFDNALLHFLREHSA